MERATMPDMSEHILLIDDDLRLSAMVGDYLRSHGYQVSNAPTLAAGRDLLARLRALLRRTGPATEDEDVWRFGRLEIDAGLRQVRLEGKVCDLTSYQFDLLSVLAQHPGRVLSRDQIMDSLKGHPLEAFDRSIDVHISRIRAAIEDDPKEPRRILTVRGVGYVFAKKQDTDTDTP